MLLFNICFREKESDIQSFSFQHDGVDCLRLGSNFYSSMSYCTLGLQPSMFKKKNNTVLLHATEIKLSYCISTFKIQILIHIFTL